MLLSSALFLAGDTFQESWRSAQPSRWIGNVPHLFFKFERDRRFLGSLRRSSKLPLSSSMQRSLERILWQSWIGFETDLSKMWSIVVRNKLSIDQYTISRAKLFSDFHCWIDNIFTSSGLDDTKSANPPKVLSDFALNALLIFVAEFAKLIFQCSNNFTNIYILANIFWGGLASSGQIAIYVLRNPWPTTLAGK